MRLNKFIYTIVIVALTSCNFLNTDDCDPNITCETTKPDSVWVDITVSSFSSVPVEIYVGDSDLGNLIITDTFYQTTGSYYLPLGKKYSARAKYIRNGVTTYVFDGTKKLKVKRFWNCDERCYEVPEANLDLKLK